MHALFMPIVAIIILLLTSGGSDDFDKAYLAGQQGRHESAIHHYTVALESGDLSRRNRARALNNRAVAYDHLGRYTAALADYQAAMTIAPDDLEITRNRSETLRRAEIQRADPFGQPEPAGIVHAANVDMTAPLRLKEKVKILGIL